MALTGKMEIEKEIKASADQFFHIARRQAHHLPNICPDKLHKIEVHEGDWETQGSVKHWSYTVVIYGLGAGGKSESFKETVESIDDENRSITFNIFEGDVMKDFKSYKMIVQAIPKGNGCLAKWTAVYEKAREDVPDPLHYRELVDSIITDIEAHLSNA